MVKRVFKYLLKVVVVLLLVVLLLGYHNNLFDVTKSSPSRRRDENLSVGEGEEVFPPRYSAVASKYVQFSGSEELKSRCPNFTLTFKHHNYSLQKCRPRFRREIDCDHALRKYGRTPKDRECPKLFSQEVSFELCKFSDDSIRTSEVAKVTVKCNIKPCGDSAVRVAILQYEDVLSMRPEYRYSAYTETDLKVYIKKMVTETRNSGLDFIILSCENKDKSIKQALVFPPFIKLRRSRAKKNETRFNVNIVVLDSVSRQHFYRQLPDSVEALMEVNKRTRVLDFHMLQSLAPRTFPNMRALFSGMVDVDSDDEANTYGIDSLFGKYNNLGYQTILQEDSCWYDQWGALITDNKHILNSASTEEYQIRWEEIHRKMQQLPIHSYGLTHFSCEVFLRYGKTNQFNDPPKVCYNGHLLPAYFLNYTTRYLQTVEKLPKAFPVFLYTHLNTGHESSGKRIAYADGLLADFLTRSSRLPNTLTILLSDHGPKTSRFSQDYLTGRYEISQALMFMLIPKPIQEYVGKDVMNALTENQHRLISHVDIFHMLMSLYLTEPAGLLTPIPTSRGCQNIPMYSFVDCLCDDWAVHLSEFHRDIHWLAEFATGYLNNKITSYSTEDMGYGNCERLIGKRFDKIRKRIKTNGVTVYTFDVVVEKYREEEFFEVVIIDSLPHPAVIKWRRVSIYQHFSKCQDSDTDIQLCICRAESAGQTNYARDVAKLLSANFFNFQSRVKYIDSKCLALITRWSTKTFQAFEITNQCVDRLYNISFSLDQTDSGHVRSSDVLPRNVTVIPWQIYFLTSVTFLDSTHLTAVTEKISFTIIKMFF